MACNDTGVQPMRGRWCFPKAQIMCIPNPNLLGQELVQYFVDLLCLCVFLIYSFQRFEDVQRLGQPTAIDTLLVDSIFVFFCWFNCVIDSVNYYSIPCSLFYSKRCICVEVFGVLFFSNCFVVVVVVVVFPLLCVLQKEDLTCSNLYTLAYVAMTKDLTDDESLFVIHSSFHRLIYILYIICVTNNAYTSTTETNIPL